MSVSEARRGPALPEEAPGAGSVPAAAPRGKVLLVGNFLAARGSWGVCESLARELAKDGWGVLTTSSRPSRAARLVDMVATAWLRRRDYAVAQVDVYSGAAFFWAEAVAWTLRRAGRPFVLTLHGGRLPEFARRHPGRVRRLLGCAAAVTAPSRYLFEEMRPYRADLEEVPNGIDLSRFPFRRRDTVGPSLVWVRSFHELYNPSLAVRVVADLAPRFPDLRLDLVGGDRGDGSLERARRTAEELGVTDRVAFVGSRSRSEIPAALAGRDIFLNTTRADNAPVSVLEAMATGLPVVSTRVGGIPYLLKDEENAILVPDDDAGAMSAAVARLLKEPGLAGRLSDGGRALVESRDWSRVVPAWTRLLEHSVAGASR